MLAWPRRRTVRSDQAGVPKGLPRSTQHRRTARADSVRGRLTCSTATGPARQRPGRQQRLPREAGPNEPRQ